MSFMSSGRVSRRKFLKTTTAGTIAAALPMGSAIASAPKRGGHFRVGKGHGQTTDTLNPGQYSNNYMWAVTFAKDGHLTEVLPDGLVGPEIAESWEGSDDGKVWRFKIRKGVMFHSGKELTPEDVVASINFHRGENATSAAAPYVKPVQE